MKRARLLLNTLQQFKVMCEKAIEEEKRSRAAAPPASTAQQDEHGDEGNYR